MIEEKELDMYYEDDSHEIPEEFLNMSIEQLERRAEVLYKDMKAHPRTGQRKDYSKLGTKFYLFEN